MSEDLVGEGAHVPSVELSTHGEEVRVDSPSCHYFTRLPRLQVWKPHEFNHTRLDRLSLFDQLEAILPLSHQYPAGLVSNEYSVEELKSSRP